MADEELDLNSLSDPDLVTQMHDDLYDGLADEIVEGTEILLGRGWDPQSVLQFHRYWSPPDRPGIRPYLDVRDRLGLPIYMGEGGENNLDWLQTAFQLYEDEEISWNFWPWKKIETLTSPYSVIAPTGWSEIVQYAAGEATRPDPEDACRTLDDLIDGFDIDRCIYRPEVVNALLRRPPSISMAG